MLIALSGYAQSGKDTTADVLVREHGFRRVAFADALKRIAYATDPYVEVGWRDFTRLRALVDQVGWDVAKQNPDVRGFLQRLGTEGGRAVLGDDIWIRTALGGLDPSQDVVITDCRFPNEAAAVRAAGGYVVRVERPGLTPPNLHASEVSMAGFDYDAVVMNNHSLRTLRTRAFLLPDLLRRVSARR